MEGYVGGDGNAVPARQAQQCAGQVLFLGAAPGKHVLEHA
jgi:hypothetical protein